MRYDSLYWTSDLDYSLIKNTLRIYGEGHTAPIVVDCWETNGKEYGVPRAWARKRGYKGTDSTVYPNLKWKPFNTTYRYNQEECIDKIIKSFETEQGALLESPTGWGKTIAAVSVASRLNTPALVLVHKEDLVKQWIKTAKDFFGTKAGKVQRDTWNYQHPLTVAMIQTLNSREIPEEFANRFGLVIVDEGHHVPCQTFANVISKLPARYRLGVSATWRRRDKLEDVWRYHIGEIRAKGVKPKIPGKYFQIPVRMSIDDRAFTRGGRINHSAMITAMSEDPKLREFLVREINEALSKGRKVLVVSQRVSQIEDLYEDFPNAGIYTGKFKGKKVKDPELEDAAKKDLILATYNKIAEGTDIPRLDTLIMATPCADPEQVYGRVDREHPGKDNIVVVDPVAPTGYNWALANKRVKVYERLGVKKG